MSTTSKAVKCELSDNIFQGDIFQNVRFNYLESEDNDSVEVIEYVFLKPVKPQNSCHQYLCVLFMTQHWRNKVNIFVTH